MLRRKSSFTLSLGGSENEIANKWVLLLAVQLFKLTVFEIRPVRRTMTDLKFLRTDWFENSPDKFTLKQMVKTTV